MLKWLKNTASLAALLTSRGGGGVGGKTGWWRLTVGFVGGVRGFCGYERGVEGGGGGNKGVNGVRGCCIMGCDWGVVGVVRVLMGL